MKAISRKTFLSSVATSVTALSLHGHAQGQGKLRTITYNVLAFRGFPRTSKTKENLDAKVSEHPELSARALKRLAPDLVTLQEGPTEALTKRFAEELGMNYVWFPGGWEGNDEYPGGFPGAVVTRFTILESENRPSAGAPHDETLFTRHLGRAVLETPLGRLQVVSTHFHASDHEVRMKEAAAITALIEKLRMNGPVLLQGDLNHRPEDPEYAVWRDAGLVDVGLKQGIGTSPTASSVRPNSRIDYIWATTDLGERSTHAEVLNMPPFVPNPDDPASYALSDHLPVLAEFSMA